MLEHAKAGDAERRMNREAVAARSLVDQIGHDDPDLTHDMVEGETSLIEAVTRALDEMDQSLAMAEGLAAMIQRYESRKFAAEKRAARMKSAIEQAMTLADMPRLMLPAATLTVKAVPPKALITNESLIPAEFWTPRAPALDKAAVNKAAKAGPVPGVEMTNGGVTLQIRRS